MKSKKIFSDKFIYTIVSIFLGFIVGGIVLSLAGFNPFEGYAVMINGIFGEVRYIAWTIIRATPLILTGLSVAFAFRTGLFNIGAEGQFIVGALSAALVGYFVKLPAIIHIPLTLISGCLAGALWAVIAGFFKARFGVNEVISTIMLNWIALYFQNYVVMLEGFRKPNSEASYDIQDTAMINIDWLRNIVGPATRVNWGIVISLILVVLIAYILYKTVLGFELRAVGFNKYAAEYAGINVNKSMITSMAIAGLLAGAAGAMHVMGVTRRVTILAAMEGYGFDGIAVSLIGNNTPLGVVLGALLFGGLKYGGSRLQTIGAPTEIINIVIGSIIYFIAASRLVKILVDKVKGGKANA
ncbi:nucleoside ABC transporter membrane protein [Alkalithermobacter thermoalcaliphilus JW-YL-7 = DSM 7308]|uniref:ABC-type transporter, integral membrane subunit n=1 Tax=Alkalithermobacter thermoalcaliphilus JW-YL-7 = DSM 7308 TaxID=1121328 RepID=A0A150FNW2_CLOPD|nr:ABC-type transporter, integral membrane subunit [[Clostridium] paradoxum JW-YL-7 = DSM 7308]SHK83626.1 nucleoside ABC transporter membrane protein [[Clostridium] paradoxum JW-YL-7 = DSM 7308]